MNREIFFKHARQNPFPDGLMQKQVDGMETILNEWDKRGLEDFRWLAYMLATAYHETAHTLQPISEYGGKDYFTLHYDVQGSNPKRAIEHGNTSPGDGVRYRGRGYVQLTWKNNYATFSKILGVDLVNEPDRALEPAIATQIMFEGMIRGLYTGVGLGRYFKSDNDECDWYNARKIVNGLDKADSIGRHGRAFWYAILMAQGELDKAAAVPKGMNEPSLPNQYKGLLQEFEGADIDEW